MTAILKVDTIQDTSGNNIINENAGTITIGKSGDTVNLAAGATAGFGKVLQVVSTSNSTNYSTSSATYQDGFSVSITPSSTSNKILIMAHNGALDSDTSGNSIRVGLHRDSTLITDTLFYFDSANPHGTIALFHLDSPSTTSAITYMVKFLKQDGGGNVYLNNSRTNNIIAMEIAG